MKKNVTVNDVIRAALPLIENEATWTYGALVRDHHSCSVSPSSPRAVCWCPAGALFKIAFDLTGDMLAADDLGSAAAAQLTAVSGYDYMLTDINDWRGREAVVALFKKALAHYKPDARTNKPVAQLAIYALALTRRVPGLRLFDIKCAWFNEEEYCEFYPRTLFTQRIGRG
jgi:hypothetical protein